MQIKNMPANERPREKLLYYGASSLNNAELMALILGSGTRTHSAVNLSENVLAYAESELGGLEYASASELMRVDGIGESKACSIVAAIELGRRLRARSSQEPRIRAGSAAEVVALIGEELRNEKREHLIELLVNQRMEIEARLTISIGVLSQAVVGPREVFAPAIKRGAAGIIIAHNHPSGDPTPSQDDIDTTSRLKEVAKLVGIELLDHLIVGRDSYTSFRELDLI